MTYVVQLEENGTVQFPEDLIESMHLKPGAKLLLENQPEDHRVVLSVREEPAQTRIYEDRGVLVYRSMNADPSYDFLGQIDEMRDERMRHIMGRSTYEDDEIR